MRYYPAYQQPQHTPVAMGYANASSGPLVSNGYYTRPAHMHSTGASGGGEVPIEPPTLVDPDGAGLNDDAFYNSLHADTLHAVFSSEASKLHVIIPRPLFKMSPKIVI